MASPTGNKWGALSGINFDAIWLQIGAANLNKRSGGSKVDPFRSREPDKRENGSGSEPKIKKISRKMHKNRIFVLYPLGEEIFPNGRGEKPDFSLPTFWGEFFHQGVNFWRFSLPTKGRDKYFTWIGLVFAILDAYQRERNFQSHS